MKTLQLAAALAASVALASAASAAPYTRVLPASTIAFSATQMGVTMPGHFTKFSASVAFDPADAASDKLSIDVDAASADAGSSQTSELVVGADWLDAAHHPKASFVARRFTAAGPGRWWVDGTFSVKGRSAPLRVLAVAHAAGADLALDADFKLQRLQWALGSGAWADTSVVGAEIPVHVHLLLAR
jgi:polyisoprenoid-binding protein YceI